MEASTRRACNVMNMRPPEIAAAWERGDIDAAFVWDPVLSKIKGNGKVHRHLGQHRQAGTPTFDGIVVNAKWAEANEAFMVAFVKALDRCRRRLPRQRGKPGRPIRRRSRRSAKWTGDAEGRRRPR